MHASQFAGAQWQVKLITAYKRTRSDFTRTVLSPDTPSWAKVPETVEAAT